VTCGNIAGIRIAGDELKTRNLGFHISEDASNPSLGAVFAPLVFAKYFFAALAVELFCSSASFATLVVKLYLFLRALRVLGGKALPECKIPT